MLLLEDLLLDHLLLEQLIACSLRLKQQLGLVLLSTRGRESLETRSGEATHGLLLLLQLRCTLLLLELLLKDSELECLLLLSGLEELLLRVWIVSVLGIRHRRELVVVKLGVGRQLLLSAE